MTKSGAPRLPRPARAWAMLATKLVKGASKSTGSSHECELGSRGRRAELTAEVAPSSILLDGEAVEMLRVPDSLLGEAQGLGRQIHVLTEMAVELAPARWVGTSRVGSRVLRFGPR